MATSNWSPKTSASDLQTIWAEVQKGLLEQWEPGAPEPRQVVYWQPPEQVPPSFLRLVRREALMDVETSDSFEDQLRYQLKKAQQKTGDDFLRAYVGEPGETDD